MVTRPAGCLLPRFMPEPVAGLGAPRHLSLHCDCTGCRLAHFARPRLRASLSPLHLCGRGGPDPRPAGQHHGSGSRKLDLPRPILLRRGTLPLALREDLRPTQPRGSVLPPLRMEWLPDCAWQVVCCPGRFPSWTRVKCIVCLPTPSSLGRCLAWADCHRGSRLSRLVCPPRRPRPHGSSCLVRSALVLGPVLV